MPGGLPNLTVQQLDYLVAVCDAPTWADAAGRLGVTPSALSQGLAELERRVGVPLFERDGRRRVLAPAAGPVLAHAREVVARTRDLADWSARTRAGRAGDLRVGMTDVAAVHHFPDALRRFRRQRPDVELRLTVAPSGPLLADLVRGALDLVVCVAPPSPVEGVALQPVRSDELGVYAPPSASRGAPATWGPWVTFPLGSHTRALVDGALRRLGAPFEVVAESHQPEVLREMVTLGLGWTVLPTVQAGRLKPVRSLTSRALVIGRRTSAAPNAAADALVTALG
ncbi:MAG TPA: LysR family transcriptional regulator [Acidimicrobiales bacterium]|nr:LysR family transcriptional regulator [Acidimicrobiales bacterium]